MRRYRDHPQQYPAANENAGDGSNTLGYRFSSNADSSFNTYITRLDYHITANGSETLFWRGETQNFKQPGQQQFPGQSAATTRAGRQQGFNRRTHFTYHSQAHQRFSLGLHSPGSDRTPVRLSIREFF